MWRQLAIPHVFWEASGSSFLGYIVISFYMTISRSTITVLTLLVEHCQPDSASRTSARKKRCENRRRRLRRQLDEADGHVGSCSGDLNQHYGNPRKRVRQKATPIRLCKQNFYGHAKRHPSLLPNPEGLSTAMRLSKRPCVLGICAPGHHHTRSQSSLHSREFHPIRTPRSYSSCRQVSNL